MGMHIGYVAVYRNPILAFRGKKSDRNRMRTRTSWNYGLKAWSLSRLPSGLQPRSDRKVDQTHCPTQQIINS